MAEAATTATLEKVEDYGLGTSTTGNPLVLATFRSDVYHRHDHGGRITSADTWDEPFLIDGWHMRPCRTCWPGSSNGSSGADG